MSESWIRRLVNARRWGSRAWKCQKVGFEGLEMPESGVRGLGNARKFASRAWKYQKVGFEGL